MSQTYKGTCFCGAVELTVSGEPVAAGSVIARRAAVGRRRPSTHSASGNPTR
jgi:hypothetical protein